MKRVLIGVIVCLFVFAFQISFSQVLNTQGVLRDGTGHSVTDGSYQITFRIWNAETGGTERFAQVSDVVVTNGVYNVTLGGVDNPLDMLNSSESYWLGVEVASDGEMTPRHKLNVSPYEFAKLTGDENVFPGSGNVGVGTTTPRSALDVDGNISLTGSINLDNAKRIWGLGRLHIGGEELLYLLNKDGVIVGKEWQGNGNLTVEGNVTAVGNVGIGTSGPRSKLQIHDGTAYVSKSVGYNATGTYTYMLMGTNQHQGNIGDRTKFLFDIESTTAGSANKLHLRSGYVEWSDDDYKIPDANHKTEIMTFSGNGNVGIGTNSPGADLHIHNSSTGATVKLTNRNNYGLSINTWTTDNRVNINPAVEGGRFHFGRDIAASGWYFESGKVGIGTTSPAYELDVNGTVRLSGGHLIFNSTHGVINVGSGGNLYFRTNTTTGNPGTYDDEAWIESDGEIKATAFIRIPYGKSSKSSAKSYENSLERTLQLKPVSFQKSDGEVLGFYTDELKKFIPEVVNEDDGITGIDYGAMSVVAIAAIQEQQQIINKQQDEIKNQQNQINDLESRLEKLETLLKKN